MLGIAKLRCEYKQNPIGLDLAVPRISWQLISDERGCVQSAYQIQVGSEVSFSAVLWDSGKIESAMSVHIELDQLQPEARTRYYYRVRAWDQPGPVTECSETAFFETRLMDARQGQAAWIGAPLAHLPKDSEVCPPLPTFVKVTGSI